MKEQVKDLIEKGYTRNDICKLLKISKGHFNRIRKELSIELKPTPSKEELRELYIEENLSLKKLSKVLNIPKNRIVRILARFNIKKSPALVKLSQIESNKETYSTGEPQKKIANTFKTKYGVDSILTLDSVKEKIKKTVIERYGVDHYSKTKEYREKFINTTRIRYGVDHPSQNEDIAKKMGDGIKKAYSTGEPQKKINDTKRLNHTFNSSKPEEIIYEKLVNHFSKEDVIRQYRSELYPFNCDFYIKSLDLYIEYQGSWCHGREPYNPNKKEHQLILEKWKKRDTDYYNIAIDRWTRSDPLKRRTAKKNNLNWKEFFSIEEINQFLLESKNG